MDLSFIIASWNAKDFLSECLQSLARENSAYDSEIIVVDNASKDGSREMVRDEFPEVMLISNKTNAGFAKANNIGIRESEGGYLFLINSDVKVLKGCIDRLVSYMDQHPEIGMLGPKILSPDGTVQRSCMGFPTLWNSFCRALALDTVFPETKLFGEQMMTFWQHDTIRCVDVINGCFWMIRAEALNQVGCLDESFFMYGEDIDWCKRFWNSGWKVVFYPDAEAIHYGGGSSSNNPIQFYLEMCRSNLQYWRKHHNRITQIGNMGILLLHHFLRILGGTFLYLTRSSGRVQASFGIKRSVACIRWLFAILLNPEGELVKPSGMESYRGESQVCADHSRTKRRRLY